ncbi:MAG: hypothetical protein LUE21_05885 [Oscillospiraceae bacterium]|nr:hypothetical protein [Oscillospiraceae bacterium]
MTQGEFDRALSAKRQKEEAIASSFSTASDAEIEALLRDFLCCKYFLEPNELNTDNLVVLGDTSTAKMAGFQKAGIVFQEKSAGCTTASSGLIKKVLLAMAVGKLIGAKLDPDAVAEADTIPQLAAVIVQTRKRVRVSWERGE